MPDRLPIGWCKRFLPLVALGCLPLLGHTQANYEIQVYGAKTVPPQTLMVELHSNFTVEGERETIDGVYPTYHQEHETIELTEGLSDWSEVGFYIFTSEQDGHGAQWVGDHIRPRIRVPDSWGWPVGVSLSTEIGFQRSAYSTDTWTWKIRPIIDKNIGRWYFAVNPALERTCTAQTSIGVWALRPARRSATTSLRLWAVALSGMPTTEQSATFRRCTISSNRSLSSLTSMCRPFGKSTLALAWAPPQPLTA
jgi:hypothetical protein